MHRYRFAQRCTTLIGSLLLLAGCALPGARENVDSAAQLVAGQVGATLEWRRDPAADAAARQRVDALLADGLTREEAVAVSFLASPLLQITLEQLEISRSELVAAATPPNPVAVIGTRKPGGDLAAFYPERSVSMGVLQNVMALLTMPDRRAVARHDLQRVRFETAQYAATHAARVVQAWLDYAAARHIDDLRRQRLDTARDAIALLAVQAANGRLEVEVVEGERAALARLERERVQLELNAEMARTRLGELLGLTGWRDDWQIDLRLPPLPVADPEEGSVEAAAMTRRLDLQAAAKAVDARLRALASQRRFRWLNQFELGLFRDEAVGGTAFTGPNAVLELPLFDQRQAALLAGDAELRTAMRRVEALQLTARSEIRLHAAELRAARRLCEQSACALTGGEEGVADGAAPSDMALLGQRIADLELAEERTGLLRDYWRARSSLAHVAGDWAGLSGLE